MNAMKQLEVVKIVQDDEIGSKVKRIQWDLKKCKIEMIDIRDIIYFMELTHHLNKIENKDVF